MKILKYLLCAVATIFTTCNAHPLFDNYLTQYNKNYTSPEYEIRRDIFIKNYVLVENNKNDDKSTFTLELNEHADKTWEEFSYGKLGYKKLSPSPTLREVYTLELDKVMDHMRKLNMDYSTQLATLFTSLKWHNRGKIHLAMNNLNTTIDWVEKGAVTPVSNQGQCGSCFSFSSVEAIEGINFLTTGKLLQLSEQQVLDCSRSYGNEGCMGGEMPLVFDYVRDHGICTAESYPYKAVVGDCKKCDTVVKIKGGSLVPSKNEMQLKYVVSRQPVSIAIEADKRLFQLYKSGVLNGDCGDNLDHGVLVVGYGERDGVPYWKVKNSWGEQWGEQGYVLLYRNDSNVGGSGMCGLALQPSYPNM